MVEIATGSRFGARAQSWVIAALGIVSFVSVFGTLGDPGLTWDESLFIPSSLNYIEWFFTLRGGLRDTFSADVITYYWRGTSGNPPFAKVASGISMITLHRFADLLIAARLPTAVFFSLLIMLTCRLVAAYYNLWAGLFSGIFLLTMPRVFGHAHLASLDVAMSLTWVTVVYTFIRGLSDKRWAVLTGLAYGVALSTKLNAFFLPLPLILWACIYHRGKYSKNLIAMLTISPLVFFISWPWLWPEPLSRFSHYLILKIMRPTIPIYYLGNTYREATAPWHYPFLMTLITTPVAPLVFAAVGAAVTIRDKFKDRIAALFIMNALTSIIVCALPSAQRYDGVRLYLPAFPFIASMAGIGLFWVTRRLTRRLHASRVLPAALFLLCLPVISIVRIHPYELSYYNMLVGGLKGAQKWGFESTYWGDTATDDLLGYLNANLPKYASVAFFPAGCNVTSLYKFTGRLRKDFRIVSHQEAQFLVLNCRQGFFDKRIWEIYKNETPLYATKHDGVLLSAVYAMRQK